MSEVSTRPAFAAGARGVLTSRLARRQEVGLILFAALLVRLWGFTAPYTDAHWIKQLQVAPIAKHFYLHGHNPLWPQVDYSADEPNYIEIEFPLVAWLTALVYPLFGIQEWVGRLVVVAFSMGMLLLLYALLRLHLGDRPAGWGLLFMAFAPSSWYFSRVLMSEPAMLFFSVALLYCFSRWLGMRGPGESLRPEAPTGGWGLALLTALCGALAFLVKLPSLVLLLPVAFLAWRKWGAGMLARPALWGMLLLAVVPALAYYRHAAENIGQHYFTVGVGFGGGMWLSLGNLLNPGAWSLMLDRLLKDHLTAVGLVLLPLGLLSWLPGRRGEVHLMQVWLLAGLLYVGVVWGGNLRQNYYQLPLLLPAAGLIGLGWERLVRSGAATRAAGAALVALFLMLCVWGVQPMFKHYAPLRDSAAALAALDPDREPVIIFPPGYGCLYYFDRPGWVGREHMGKPPEQVAPQDLPGPLYVADRIARGARWAAYLGGGGPGERPDLRAWLAENYTVAREGEDWEIYDLRRPRTPPASTSLPSQESPG